MQWLPGAAAAERGPAGATRRGDQLRRLRPDHLPGASNLLKLTAFIDGAARGNPGPAGYGVFATTDTGEVIEVSGYLGETTNNVAEYCGLVEALRLAKEIGADQVEIVSDSELLVKQMKGIYKVKNEKLKLFHARAIDLARTFSDFDIRHTLRAGNKEADRLANVAVDRGDDPRLVERRNA